MYIIEVIPIQHLPKNVSQVLTYFHKNPLKQGAIVEISVGYQNILGLVTNCVLLEKVKNEIKASHFTAKKIKKIISEKPITSSSFWKISKFISNYYFDDLTRVVKILLPKNLPSIIKQLQKQIETKPIDQTKILLNSHQSSPKISSKLISKIENTLKNNKSVFLAFSTNADLSFYQEYFSQIFNNDFFIIIDEQLTQKKLNKYYHELLINSPKIIFSLRKGLGLPLDNVNLIAVFNSNDDSYKSWDLRPYFNFETTLKWFAKNNKIEIFFDKNNLDINLLETLKENYQEIKSENLKTNKITTKIIYSDLFKYDRQLLSGTFKKQIEISKNEKWIFFISKKGFFTQLHCQKCGFIFVCPKCHKPLSYYPASKNEFFFCNLCQSKFYTKECCPRCKSKQLSAVGAGLDKLTNELIEFVKQFNMPIYTIDSSKNQQEITKTIEKFNLKENGILIGTSNILKPQLNPVDHVCAIYIDNLFYLPDYKMEEKILTILLKLKKLSNKNFYIKTGIEKHEIFEIIENEYFKDFWKNELILRKKYQFPPYSQITQITNKNKDKNLLKQELTNAFIKIEKTIKKNKLEEKFILIPPSANFNERINNQYQWNFKIKTILEKPPIISLKEIKIRNQLLNLLPNHFYIDVDPLNTI